MKEIRETKMVEQTTIKYVADDGKEFTDKFECDSYERRKDTELLNAKLKAIMTAIEIPILEWCGWYAYKVKVRNADDIINLYTRYDDENFSFKEFEEFFEIGKVVYLVVSEDGYPSFYKRDLEDELKNIFKKKTEKKTDK